MFQAGNGFLCALSPTFCAMFAAADANSATFVRLFINFHFSAMLIYILLFVAFMLALVGIVGAIVPALPGPPVSFAALLIAFFFGDGEITSTTLLVMFVLTVVVTVFDYVAPVWLTKLGGGSKYAVWGSTVGLLVGLFFMPLGLLLGPLVGAFVGELWHNQQAGKAVRVAMMSFIAFLLTTGLKLILSVVMMAQVIFATF